MRAGFQVLLLCTCITIKIAFSGGDGVCSGTGEPRKCCPNYMMVNGTCIECPVGRYGINCSDVCPPNYYGQSCLNQCNCSVNHTCDSINGCVPIVKVKEGEQGGNLVTDDSGVHPGIWATLVIVLALSVSGFITLVVILIKRKHAVHKFKTESRDPVAPYAVQSLKNLNDIDENDTAYAEVVRDVTKIEQNYKPFTGPVSDGNIYSTNVSEVPYDKLQFYPKSATILKDHELELYGFPIQKI